jgi:hypothetical protein
MSSLKKPGVPMSPSRTTLVLLLLIGAILLTSGCIKYHPYSDEDRWVIPADKYVFIDRHVSTSGEAINGTCGGGMMIDFPMYSFNKASGELSGMSARELVVNDSLKIVYGDGVSIGGVLGGGASTYLTPVYTLPFEKGEVIITGVNPDGLAVLASGNETMILSAGDTWTNVTTRVTSDFPGNDGACFVKITTKKTIYNAGIVEKSGIEREK